MDANDEPDRLYFGVEETAARISHCLRDYEAATIRYDPKPGQNDDWPDTLGIWNRVAELVSRQIGTPVGLQIVERNSAEFFVL